MTTSQYQRAQEIFSVSEELEADLMKIDLLKSRYENRASPIVTFRELAEYEVTVTFFRDEDMIAILVKTASRLQKELANLKKELDKL